MLAKTKAWSVIKTVPLCHRFGNREPSTIAKLPIELVTGIEEVLIILEGAPNSMDSMTQAHNRKTRGSLAKGKQGKVPTALGWPKNT